MANNNDTQHSAAQMRRYKMRDCWQNVNVKSAEAKAIEEHRMALHNGNHYFNGISVSAWVSGWLLQGRINNLFVNNLVGFACGQYDVVASIILNWQAAAEAPAVAISPCHIAAVLVAHTWVCTVMYANVKVCGALAHTVSFDKNISCYDCKMRQTRVLIKQISSQRNAIIYTTY